MFNTLRAMTPRLVGLVLMLLGLALLSGSVSAFLAGCLIGGGFMLLVLGDDVLTANPLIQAVHPWVLLVARRPRRSL